jgi:alpha-ketoglutarate-dependent taurine dioxygenase
LLEWNFGEVLELEVTEKPDNYLFTNGDVPLHWDGAFAEQEPHYQLFQCLKAPLEGSGGETVFCDAIAPLNQADPIWNEVCIAYRTEKLAHYGGEIRSPLITPHPGSGEPRIRFAEPPGKDTADLNPLFLDIEGAGPEIVEQLRQVLYHPDNCLNHAWHDGDFLVADNFSLLHGRRPFSSHSPRHIQRIHIL